jgi:ribosome-associated protein
MLKLSQQVSIPESEIVVSAVRSQGAGGQNVNKVATAIHLRFDSQASSLPESYKQRLLLCRDRRITRDGVIIIKAQEFRSQEQNKAIALERLADLIRSAVVVRKTRKTTRPGPGARKKRLESKTQRGKIKRLRAKKIIYE